MPGPTTSTRPASRSDLHEAATLLRATRGLSALATVFLAVQLFGNLYEEIVTNVANIADPQPGSSVGALAPGSPLYYYLPWAPLGVVLVAVLAVRLPSLGAPAWVTARVRGAVAALAVGVAGKVVLITQVNPVFRDPGRDVASVRSWAVFWAFGNGVAILAVATGMALLLTWRAALLNDATRTSAAPVDTGAVAEART